jgi:type I restriction enzyme M protein
MARRKNAERGSIQSLELQLWSAAHAPNSHADFALALPPFHDSAWSGELLKEDMRGAHGLPPTRNANFDWMLHVISHLAPAGIAACALANHSMPANRSPEAVVW